MELPGIAPFYGTASLDAADCDDNQLTRNAIPQDDHSQPQGDTRLLREKTLLSQAMTDEEREILDRFERDELRSIPEAEREMELTRRMTRNTFNKTRRVNLRVTERDFNLARSRAREEGIPYQTLLSSVIHKYLSGRLIERQGKIAHRAASLSSRDSDYTL